MARMTGYKNPFDDLADAFGKQPNSIGNMHGKAMGLHAKTMKPVVGIGVPPGATKGNGPGMGNPMAGALGKSVQSPAQHDAVEKAARASANKRRKF